MIFELNRLYLGITDYIANKTGTLRNHVNVYVDDALIWDRVKLSDEIAEGFKVYVMQTISSD